MSQATRALAHAFDTGALAERRAFFLRAEDPPFTEIDAEQSFRPAYLRLAKAVPRLESGGHELGLVLLTKHKEENFANIARGWALLEPGGTLVCTGSNDDGAPSGVALPVVVDRALAQKYPSKAVRRLAQLGCIRLSTERMGFSPQAQQRNGGARR